MTSPTDIDKTITELFKLSDSQPRPDTFVISNGPVADEVRKLVGIDPEQSTRIEIDTLAEACLNVDLTHDGVKIYPIHRPASYDVREIEEASAAGRSIFAEFESRHEAMIAAMRERELAQAAVFETTNADGEKVLFTMREPDSIQLRMPMLPAPLDPDPVRFMFGQQLGGFVRRDPIDSIITVTSLPTPIAPGVVVMLADGWVWTGFRFARDQELGHEETIRTNRYAGFVTDRRVYSGRYAERLPTNRKRKRERAKARRRRARQVNS